MLMKKFNGLDRENSLIGMGVMRLLEDEKGKVDTDEAIRLLRYAIDNGINYIDTAYTYHGGMSEKIVGMGL